ncbi:outer membrane protein transport protein [Thiobacillus sp.]|uniref:outer membrane protein transport protein n=1 Tax=Thiobacillus sp. TaxID=924 RepID=UPI0025E2A0B2|nr:outer membrane protein transport protein [Thiobacillus sp.]
MKRMNLGHVKMKALLAAMAVTQASVALATNGYFLPGAGYRSQGMGGVGIAYGRDSLSIAANPANIVNTGMRGDLGFGVFNPERYAAVGRSAGQVSPFGFNNGAESDSRYFIVPEMGVTMPLTEELHVGFAVLGNGGMNTNYPVNLFNYTGAPNSAKGPGKDKKIGIDMMQLLVPVTVGYKVNETNSVGAALVLAETRFRAYGLGAFKAFDQILNMTITSDPNHLTDQGFDYSYGAGVKLGWLGNFLDDKLTVGLAYTSRTYMTKFDKYRGLFAEQGGFDIPENYGIGITIKPKKNLVISADISRINYAKIASIGNRGMTTSVGDYTDPSVQVAGIPSTTDPTKELGNDEGMGFGWKNQTVYKVGAQYGVNNRLQIRAGYNYGKSPIQDDQLTFNVLAPATVESHYTVGFTYKASDELEITGVYLYAAPNNQTSPANQNIVGKAYAGMHQNVFGVSLGWVLDPGPHTAEEYGDGDWAGINFTNWYAGLGIGQSNYRDFDATSVSGRSEAWKTYAGYQFNKYLALEGGYVNLNDMTARTGTTHTNIATDAWALGALLSYPVTDTFAVTAKLGAAYMLADVKRKTGSALTVRSGDDGYEPNYGVGIRYALLDNVDLRAEWERFDRSNMNIDLLSAGLAVKF